MNSQDLAQYIESTDGLAKPWLLLQLRLQKLKECRDSFSEDEYTAALADCHQALMSLGEWWIGIEDEVFGQD